MFHIRAHMPRAEKPVRYTIRLTKAEHEALTEAARREGLTLADFTRTGMLMAIRRQRRKAKRRAQEAAANAVAEPGTV